MEAFMTFHQIRLTKLFALAISCCLSATLFTVHSQPSRRQNTQRRERMQRPPEPPFVDFSYAADLKKSAEGVKLIVGKWLMGWLIDQLLDSEVEKVQEKLKDKARRSGGRLVDGELYQKVEFVDRFDNPIGYQLRFVGFGPTIRAAMRRGSNTPRLEPPSSGRVRRNGNLVFWGPGFVVAPTFAAPDLSDAFGKPIEDFIAEQMEQIRAKAALSGQASNETSTRPPIRPRPSNPSPAGGREPRGGPDPQRGSPGGRGGGGGNAGQGGSRGNSGQTGGGGTGSRRDETGGATPRGGRVLPLRIITAGGPLPALAEGRPRFIGTPDTPQRITELGTPHGRAWADFNGDRIPDMCVVLSDLPNTTGLCVTLSTGRSINQRAAGREIVSRDVDVGDPDGRAWVDFNRDGKADYCRVVGTPGNFHLQVTLSAGDRFGSTITSSETIDPGIKQTRNWVDWDGDRIPDFVRVIERPRFNPGIAITFGSATGFGPTIDNLTSRPTDARGNPIQVEIAGVRREDLPRFLNIFDIGDADLTLWLDVNGDGKADYVRVVGSNKDLVSVTFSNGRSFGLTLTEPLLATK